MGAPRLPEPPEEPRAQPIGRPPRPLLQKLVGPLIVYHVLIFFGAFLIVVAGGWGLWRILGVALVVLGITVEIAILAWSASLTRSASARPAAALARLSTLPPRALRRVCIACGREGSEGSTICPRCGRATVSLGHAE